MVKTSRLLFPLFLAFGLVVILLVSVQQSALSATGKVNNPVQDSHFSSQILNLPLQFIPNAGQTAPQVRFTVKGAGHSLFFTPDEVVFSAIQEDEKSAQRDLLRLRFVGANPNPAIEGLTPLRGVANFFLGNDPAAWRTNLPITRKP